MQFGAIFSAVSSCKKAYDAVSNIRKTPEEAYVLWQLLDAMEPAVLLAGRLQGRQETSYVVRAAMGFVHETIHLCDVILTRDEPNGRPYEANSWSEWWEAVPGKAKESLSRLQLVPKLTTRIQQCAAMLQLALSTAALSNTPQRAINGSQSFRLLSSAAEDSRRMFHLFEAGRLDKFYELECPQYQLCAGPLSKGDAVLSSHVAVILRRNESKKYELLFVDGDAIAAIRETQGEASASGAKTTVSHKAKLEPIAVLDPATWTTPVKRTLRRSTIQYTFPSDKPGGAFVVNFSACTVPGQYTFFPVGNETYTHVTAEVLDIVLASLYVLCRTTQGNSCSQQVDRVVPLFSDDDDEKEKLAMEQFLKSNLNATYEN